MTAFLMTWKETGWPYEELVHLVHAFERQGFVNEPWRIVAHKQTSPGDRVWVLKQGKGRKGIFGAGRITGEPGLGDAGNGKTQMMVPVQFEALVDPKKQFLIDERSVRLILKPEQVRAQASGYPIDDAQSAAFEDLLLREQPHVGTGATGDWREPELSAIVADYFSMLKAELAGQSYSKTEHRDRLRESMRRSEGSIEFKHQNISAVLQEFGLPWINGYKPRGNYQGALLHAVEGQLEKEDIGRLDDFVPSLPQVVDPSAVFVSAPAPAVINSERTTRRVPTKFDPAARDAANRHLGREGEKFVFALEQSRLTAAGRHDLAEKVVWASNRHGDGLGYDIESFEIDGRTLFIEVKTTRGPINTAFYVSENERKVAAQRREEFALYRLFGFGPEPKVYSLRGALEKTLTLEPVAYRARVGGA
jgi:hypothetical protein